MCTLVIYPKPNQTFICLLQFPSCVLKCQKHRQFSKLFMSIILRETIQNRRDFKIKHRNCQIMELFMSYYRKKKEMFLNKDKNRCHINRLKSEDVSL